MTNLQIRVGDYAIVGQRDIAVVDADSFWTDAYFEGTAPVRIREGDPAWLRLISYRLTLGPEAQRNGKAMYVDWHRKLPS